MRRASTLSLDSKIEGNQSHLVPNSGEDGMTWDDTKTIVNKHYPQNVKNGTLPNDGTLGTVICKLDTTETQRTYSVLSLRTTRTAWPAS